MKAVMNPDELVFGVIEYVVFLLSTTCHEAAHALVAKWGGDLTAAEGGQVSLNPVPHIQREPFGMVLVPLIGIVSGGGLIGWASAPYDPVWQQRYPKRAAWMSLAGPVANYLLALLALIALKIGLYAGWFAFGPHLVQSASQNEVLDGVALVLSTFFSLNLLLGTFNLLPIPPLDGYSVLGLFLPDRYALQMQEFRVKIRGFAFLGIMLGWRYFEQFYAPIYIAALHVLHSGHAR